ncbi:MAG: hypothetical protein ACI89E_001212 [Planctomycetota bacterium]|jgi:hypothetical protein
MHKDLFGSKIAEALASLPPEWDALRCLTHLRRTFPPELAREAAQLHSLQERCKARIGKDLLPFLRDPGSQQISAPRIAQQRAKRISELTPNSHVWDSTCGLGMESVHLSLAGHQTISTDLCPITLAYAAANLRHHALPEWVLQADATGDAVRTSHVLIDPDRRPKGTRTLDPREWSPSLSTSLEVLQRHAGGVAKLPPSMDIPPEWDKQHAVHWVSLAGQLLECTLWTGDWAPEPGRSAILLGKGGQEFAYAGTPEEISACTPDEAKEIRFLADPDPSIVRAGLLGHLARAQGLKPLAPRLGYLGGDSPPSSPFLTGFRVRASSALDRKKIRRMLGEHDIGPIQVRQRGHDEPSEVLERKLRGPGSQRGILAVARLDRGRWVYLLEPLTGPGDPN